MQQLLQHHWIKFIEPLHKLLQQKHLLLMHLQELTKDQLLHKEVLYQLEYHLVVDQLKKEQKESLQQLAVQVIKIQN
jgi:hypothetical protein